VTLSLLAEEEEVAQQLLLELVARWRVHMWHQGLK
jgi:hypothetical protein